MAWYYVVNGSSLGPVEVEEMQNLRRQNVIVSDTPVWTEGMAEWTTFKRSALASSAPVGMQMCAECGKPFPEDEMLRYENSWVCPACKPLFFQRMREGVAPAGVLALASIGRRWAAIVLDYLIIMFVLIVPLIVVMSFMIASQIHEVAPGTPPTLPAWYMPIMMLLIWGGPAFYEIFFVGKYAATPGKMIMKIKVTNADGEPISYGRSTGRYFAKLLSRFILYIGYLLAIWDDEKRTLHDRICETRVVKTAQP